MNRQAERAARRMILGLAALLSACAAQPPQAEPALSAGAATETAASAAAAAPPQPAPAAIPVPAVTAKSGEEPSKEAQKPAEKAVEQEPIKAAYTMNKNYDIVPKEPDGNKKVVLLTFDDGPKDANMLADLMNTLDKHKAKAIFFVNGYRIKQKPELLKLIHERGQVLGNHSWDHIDLKKEPAEKVEKQIRDVQSIVRELTGRAPRFFRPPHGSGSEHVRKVVQDEEMLYMTWSNGSEDWVAKYQNPEGLTSRVMDQLHPGSNILMHELPWTARALDGLLTKLEEKGYSFVDPNSIEVPTR